MVKKDVVMPGLEPTHIMPYGQKQIGSGHGGCGSREGGRAPAEAEPRGDKLGRRGQGRGLGPIGEQ